MITKCILCGGTKIYLKDTINFADLKRMYRHVLNLDIEKCWEVAYEKPTVPLFACKNCTLTFFPPQLSGTNFFYEQLGQNNWYYEKNKWEFIEALQELSIAESILEIGCGDGHFLELLKKDHTNLKITGLELNNNAVKQGRKKAFDVCNQTIEAFAREEKNHARFDAICSFQVIEHVANPQSFIESSLKCLKKNGFFIISMPNNKGFLQFVTNDILNMPPHHVSRWTVDVIDFLAQKYHLELCSLKEEPVAQYHKQSYRRNLLKKYISSFIGFKPKLIERSRLIYKAIAGLAFIIDTVVPKKLWKYKKYGGHTFYAVLKKI